MKRGEDLVLPEEFSRRILRRSLATMACSSVAICFGRPVYAAISIGTMCLSMLYWRRPVRGSWRRKADVGWLAAGFCIQAARAAVELGGVRAAAYWCLALATMGCYARARARGRDGNFDRSSEWHARIHVVGEPDRRPRVPRMPRSGDARRPLGNVANCVLYPDPDVSARAFNYTYVIPSLFFSSHERGPVRTDALS